MIAVKPASNQYKLPDNKLKFYVYDPICYRGDIRLNVGHFSFIIDKALNSRSYHTLTPLWLDFIAKILVRTYFGNYLQKTIQK